MNKLGGKKWFALISLFIVIGILGKMSVARYSTQALFKEMKEPDVHMVEHWLKFGANPNAVDYEGTPLLLIAISGAQTPGISNSHHINYDVVERLLDYGANPNTSLGAIQVTPLMVASAFGQPQIVELLIRRGAKVNARTSKADGGRTALSMTRKNLKHMKIAQPKNLNWERVEKILLAAGAKS